MTHVQTTASVADINKITGLQSTAIDIDYTISKIMSTGISLATILFLSGAISTDGKGNTYYDNNYGDNVKTSAGKALQMTSSQSLDITFPSSKHIVYLDDFVDGKQVNNSDANGITTTSLTDGIFKDFYAFDKVLSTKELDYMSSNPNKFFNEINLVGNAPFVTPASFADITDYGAVGDGVTDNVQAFIDAFLANENVYVPAGEFIVSDNSHILSSTRILFGEGTLTTSGTNSILTTRDQLQDVIVNGLTFKSTKSKAILFNGKMMDNIIIQNCTFIGSDDTSENAILLVGNENGKLTNFKIVNNTFIDIPRACLEILQRATDMTQEDVIQGVYIANNKATFTDGHYNDAFNPFVSLSKAVTDTIIEYNYVNGYTWGIEFADSVNSTARYNVFLNITGASFSIESAKDVVVEYNYINDEVSAFHISGTNLSTTGYVKHNTFICEGFNLQNLNTEGLLVISENHINASGYYAITFNGCTRTIFEKNYLEYTGTSHGSFMIGADLQSDDTVIVRNNMVFNPLGVNLTQLVNDSTVHFENNIETIQEQDDTIYSGVQLVDSLTASLPLTEEGSDKYDYKQKVSFTVASYDATSDFKNVSYGTQETKFKRDSLGLIEVYTRDKLYFDGVQTLLVPNEGLVTPSVGEYSSIVMDSDNVITYNV